MVIEFSKLQGLCGGVGAGLSTIKEHEGIFWHDGSLACLGGYIGIC